MINQTLYKSISSVVSEAKPRVRLTNNWHILNEENGIGRVSTCGKWLQLSSLDRMALVDLVKSQTGIDPRQVSYEQAVKRTRTEVAAFSNEEKGLSAAVRGNHVEVKGLSGYVGEYRHPTNGYIGMTVEEATSLPITHLVTVENFDTFVCLQAQHLPMLPAESTVLVFRGDNKAHPGAVKKLVNHTSACRFHFGDYDSAGLRIGLNMGHGTKLLLPDLEQINGEELRLLSKQGTFADQEEILRQLEHLSKDLPVKLIPHLQLIRENNIAVTQESLMANRVPLAILSP